jgi:hypothetical protein
MQIVLDPNDVNDYRTFVKAKSLPRFRCRGHEIEFPDEYASLLGMSPVNDFADVDYSPINGLFDYQRDIARLAIRKRKFAVFMECGLGKDLIMKEFVRHCSLVMPNKKSSCCRR